jgi:hypothetical protein
MAPAADSPPPFAEAEVPPTRLLQEAGLPQRVCVSRCLQSVHVTGESHLLPRTPTRDR